MKKLTLTTLSITASALLVGCGGGATDATTSTGTFVDSVVEGCDYSTSSGITGQTDEQGRFQYKKGDTVTLSLGNLTLGTATPQTDGLITPTDLSGDEENTTTLILQTLQTLDSDGNASNGITITQEVHQTLESIHQTHIKDLDEETLLTLDPTLQTHLDHDNDGHIDVDETQAITHYENSLDEWRIKHDGQDANRGDEGERGETGKGDKDNFDINTLPMSTLTPELKDAIAYMGNEEKLAYDVYTNLYSFHQQNNGTTLETLYTVANNSETKHIAMVQDMVNKYQLTNSDVTNLTESDSNISEQESNDTLAFQTMPSGEYNIESIQSLYNSLYDEGIQSPTDALLVGCKVEVTDITDLNEKILLAQTSKADDIKAGFTKMRDASYNHYWAFDKALKDAGVTNGCYVEGDALLTDKSELYPQNEENENSNNLERGGEGDKGKGDAQEEAHQNGEKGNKGGEKENENKENEDD